MRLYNTVMRIATVMLAVAAVSCSCMPVKDLAPAPSTLGHQRLLMSIDGEVHAGVIGVVGTDHDLRIQTYKTGTYEMRGIGECGFVWGEGFKDARWVQLDLSSIPRSPVCLLSLVARVNGLDSPATASVLVRRFDDPNVVPLTIAANGRERPGANWLQIPSEGARLMGYIPESKEIVLRPSGRSGKIHIRGCGLSESEEFDQPGEWRTNVYALYKSHKGGIDETCVFDFLVNNDDQLKEGASLLVSVYQPYGSFLEAPTTKRDGGRRCFEFQDPYVVSMAVNGDGHDRWNRRQKCVKVTDRYEVDGLTSKMRTFYGVFAESSQKWEVVR